MEFSLDIDITSNKDQIKEAVVKQLLLGLRAVGETAAGYAREDCPVDTGLLRNSIAYGLAGETPVTEGGGHGYSDDSAGNSGSYTGQLPATSKNELTLYIGSNVEYAPYVEYRDLRHTSGKAHFLRDAIQDNIDEYKEILEAALSAGK